MYQEIRNKLGKFQTKDDHMDQTSWAKQAANCSLTHESKKRLDNSHMQTLLYKAHVELITNPCQTKLKASAWRSVNVQLAQAHKASAEAERRPDIYSVSTNTLRTAV